MATLDLSKYGIKDVKEVLHNPSYDVLFAEETKPGLEGFEKGQDVYKRQENYEKWWRKCYRVHSETELRTE